MSSRKNLIRFCENNFAELISSSIEYSSELAAFPFSNATNRFRSRLWKPSGCFVITNENKFLYINDGSNKTVELDTGKYASPSALAAHMQTKLNEVSSGWSVTHAQSDGYRFRFLRSGGGVLRLSQQTNAVWQTIGFSGTDNVSGTSILAHEQRNHTEEFAVFDLGYQANIKFFAMIGPLSEVFPVSSSATITLSANNLNEWQSPPFSVSIARDDAGIFRFLDDFEDTRYRYWRISIVDKYNPRGPQGLSFGHIYLGDYVEIENRTVNRGFSVQVQDVSHALESESGALYFDKKTKYSEMRNLVFGVVDKNAKDTLERMFYRLGRTTPFYCSIDPTLCVSNSLGELTKYCIFDSSPTIQHVVADKYSFSFSLREVV